jgi:HEAT repeat protein
MMLHVLSLLALASIPSGAPAGFAPLAFQDDEKKDVADSRPEVKALIDELDKEIKERGKRDEEAIAVIDKLLGEFEQSGPKDRVAIANAMGDCLKVKRAEIEEDVPDERLYRAAAVALGRMAPECVKVLLANLDSKILEDLAKAMREVVLSLGKTKSPEAVKPLIDLLPHKDSWMQAATAEALGMYGLADEKTRKAIFEAILKVMMGQKNKVDTDPNDIEARERWDVIGPPMIQALSNLTGQDIRDPQEWQRFWNKNKKEAWPEGR